jgi:hypothetical protein
MNKIQNYMWRKGLILSATFLLTTLFVVSCKKKENVIGENTINSNELLSSAGLDTFSLTTYTIVEDSVITDNPAFGILGSYNDPEFGTVSSEIYTQFRLSGLNPNFGTDPIVVDSFVLGLEYVGLYGKTGTQTFEVYEINDADDMSVDSTYYSFTTFGTDPTNLLMPGMEVIDLDPDNITVIEDDTVESQIRIHIDTNLARNIINEAINNPTTFETNDNFLQYFKGLHIKTNNGLQMPGDGGLGYFNLGDANSKLSIYYTQNGDSKAYDLLINSECADFNHVVVDNAMTNVEAVINDSTLGQYEFYAQSFNSRAVVQIPGLDNIPANSVVHKATLELPIQYQTGAEYSPGSDISVVYKDADGTLFSIGVLGSYDDYYKRFTIDLRGYVQAVLSGEIDNTGLILSPVLFITSGDRIIFNGPETNNKEKPRFSIVYTEY